jgi:hypothetical protein
LDGGAKKTRDLKPMGGYRESLGHEAATQGSAREIEGPAQALNGADFAGELDRPSDQVAGVAVHPDSPKSKEVRHGQGKVVGTGAEKIREVFRVQARVEGQDRRRPAEFGDLQERCLLRDPLGWREHQDKSHPRGPSRDGGDVPTAAAL